MCSVVRHWHMKDFNDLDLEVCWDLPQQSMNSTQILSTVNTIHGSEVSWTVSFPIHELFMINSLVLVPNIWELIYLFCIDISVQSSWMIPWLKSVMWLVTNLQSGHQRPAQKPVHFTWLCTKNLSVTFINNMRKSGHKIICL